MSLPTDPQERKGVPICTGVLDYFPDALAAVAYCSKVGNDQHNPGQPLHWAKEKSTDHADCLIRHLTERGTIDTDGISHTAKVAWRALALLQTEIEDGKVQRVPEEESKDSEFADAYREICREAESKRKQLIDERREQLNRIFNDYRNNIQ